MQTALPPGTRSGLTAVTAEFALLPRPGWAVWPSLASLARNDAQYVMTQSQPLCQGYGYAAPELLAGSEAHARPVFPFTGPSSGRPSSGGSTPAPSGPRSRPGEMLPPVTGGFS